MTDIENEALDQVLDDLRILAAEHSDHASALIRVLRTVRDLMWDMIDMPEVTP